MPETHTLDVSGAYELLIKHIMSKLHGKKASNGWYNIRGDSFCTTCATHKRSALYILVKEGSPPALNCFRAGCGERKVMAASDFGRIGFYNHEAIKLIVNESAKGTKSYINTATHNHLIRKVDLSIYQKETLRDRCRMTNDEIKSAVDKFRIIPDVVKVIEDNYEDPNIRYKFSYLKDVSKRGEAVVFATDDYNTFAIRSEKLKGMISINESVFTGYTLKSDLCDNVENLVITEGIFDILNIKRFYCDIDNAMFIATLGFANMFNLIKRYYIKHIDTVKSLIIFADSDINRGESYSYNKVQYNKLLNKINKEFGSQAFKEIFIVYNTDSKDFGDFRNNITPKKIRLL